MSQSLALSNLSLASSSYRSLSEEDQRKVREYKAEREARSLAVEKAYVHDVYDQISGNNTTPASTQPLVSPLRQLHRQPLPTVASSQAVPDRPGAWLLRLRCW